MLPEILLLFVFLAFWTWVDIPNKGQFVFILLPCESCALTYSLLSPDNVRTSECARIYLGLSYREFTLLWRSMWSSSWLVFKNAASNRNTCLLQKSALKGKIFIIVRFLKNPSFLCHKSGSPVTGLHWHTVTNWLKAIYVQGWGQISMKHCLQTNKLSDDGQNL